MAPTDDREPLAAFLSNRDVPCPACGYNLRGLAADRCPECNQHLTLTVSLVDPPIVTYVLGVVGLAACGAAFGMLLLGVLFIMLADGGPPRGEEALMLVWTPAAIVAGDAVAVALSLRPSRRRWFRTRSVSGRWLAAAACWGASLAVFGTWLGVLFKLL